MIYRKSLFAAGLLASSVVLTGTPLFAADGTISPHERHELRHDHWEIKGDRTDIRSDRRDIHSDRKELYGDRRELVRDRHELHQDLRNGSGTAEIAQDMK